MARYIEQNGLRDIETIIKKITGFEEDEDNFDICVQFAVSNLKYHRFLSVDSHKVTRSLHGVCDKFRIHSDTTRAQKLQDLSEKFLESPVFEQKTVGKTDTHYAILSFLMLIADNPVNSQYFETRREAQQASSHLLWMYSLVCVGPGLPTLQTDTHYAILSFLPLIADNPVNSKDFETRRQAQQEEEEAFDWGAYLLDGIERYVPSDDDSSDWTDEEDTLEERDTEVTSPRGQQTDGVTGHLQMTAYYKSLSDGSTYYGAEPEQYEGADWLSRNLVAQYWRGEKLDIDTGQYLTCQLSRDWDVYKQNIDPLSGKTKETMVTENILLREVLWMLMGVSRLYLFKFNGKFFTPRPDIAVMHLSQESLQNTLAEFTRYGSYIQVLQGFVRDCCHGNQNGGDDVSQTYQAFATCVSEFLQAFKQGMSRMESRLIKQEEVISLMSLLSELKPHLNKVMIIYSIYMRGVQQGELYDLHSQRATLLLTTLYNTMMSCDALFEASVSIDGGENVENGNSSSEVLKLLLPIWLQTCQPFINIIDTWISCGYLIDPKQEFIIQRNKNIDTLDETFWEKSFAFHTMADEKTKDYSPLDWAPKFLQPVLQHIVLTGKSMEMLEGLGKLAEFENRKKLNLLEFKEGHLYDKFLTSLKSLLGTKPTSTEESQQRGTTPTLFSPDVERQMRDKGIYDSFLQLNFESLMTVNDDNHTLLDDKFTRLINSLDLEKLQPVELILQESLYPHIERQYERVCSKLVQILKTQYKLMECLASIKNFFLMEAGDCMFVFYTEIFDKIRLHEHWRDTTAVTWFLHEALEYHFPDEISQIFVVIETPDTHKDIQPINVTDCIKLQYQVPVPLDVVVNTRCQEIYNQIFSFLLQVKRAKYCLDELRFYDLAKETVIPRSEDIFSSSSVENVSRDEKIHRMHLLRMKLIYFANSLHNYIMTRILHSTGLEFHKELETAADLDQIIEIHAAYVRTIHERCLLHRRTTFLKEAVMKVLNLILLFQTKWDQGIDLISLSQIEDIDKDFDRCIMFLSSFLKSVIQRGSFPHLESLAFGLETLMPS